MIRFGHELCHDLDAASHREWLETNGIGGFSSSTVSLANTRRYHALLTAALKPPVGRHVLLSKLEETLIVDGTPYSLSTNHYEPFAVHPSGYQLMREFRLDPFPIFMFEAGEVEIEKSVFMIHAENSVVVQYRLRRAEGRHVRMEVRPLIAFRDFHALTHENPALNGHVEVGKSIASIKPYPDLPALHFAHDAEHIDTTGFWFRHFRYDREHERGLDSIEDLYSPLCLSFDFVTPEISIIASTEPRDIGRGAEYRRNEILRRQAIIAASPSTDEFITALVAAADQFLVRRESGSSVIAGYPWFSDWGRDTMISLPGLTLITGRKQEARSILLEFSRYLDQGMLPNHFPDEGSVAYNSVDATLWYFEAIRALGEPDFVRSQLYETLKSIIDWFERGTYYGIHAGIDGLLSAGEPGVQLTWMDAKVAEWVVTPRIGKPVEVQALWYNALRIMEDFANRFKDSDAATHYRQIADDAAVSFAPLFWNGEMNCLYDVIGRDGARDASIRPNQIFAVSLPHALLSQQQARNVVDIVERELLTPGGLRSLSPRDPAYRGRYEGDQRSRDGAYHQGTVWPWLMGPFLAAYLKTHGAEGRPQARVWLDYFRGQLNRGGLGQIGEIYDGDFPEEPRGAIAQAWSVAELLRAAVEVFII